MKLIIDIPEDMYNDAEILMVKELPELKKIIANGTPLNWNMVSDGLPKDGTWNIWQSKTGQISIERYKEDAYDHFYPSGRFFELEDAIAWMPAPERCTVTKESEVKDNG